MRRTLPYLFVLFIIAYMDRVNLSYAGPLGMNQDLKFLPDVYGWGAGIFFIGYFLLEIPGCLIAEKWSARAWLSRIMVSWGIVAVLMGFIQNANQFYWARFLLGAAEAGFFPAIIVYLSHWYRYEDRGKAVAIFMAAIPIANLIVAPVSGYLVGIHWLGLTGWRWVFIIEGIPAIIFGFVTFFYLSDWPHQAKWLPRDEREWIMAELEEEKRLKRAAHPVGMWESLKQPAVMLLALIYFSAITSLYGFAFWLPTFVKRLSGDLPNFWVAVVSALPYCLALVGMILFGWSSDRTRERFWHTAAPLAILALGLYLSAVTRDYLVISVFAFCVAGIGQSSFFPAFWALPTSFLTESAAAVAIGLINSIGNLGGYVGPVIVGRLEIKTHSSFAGIIFLSASAVVSAGLVLVLRHIMRPAKPSPVSR